MLCQSVCYSSPLMNAGFLPTLWYTHTMKVAKTYTLSPEARSEIRAAIARSLGEERAVQLAYLFGSFLSDDGFNDIDLGILIDETEVPDERQRFQYQLQLGVQLERDIGYPVDVVILNEASLALRFRVVSEGEVLVCRDEQQRVAFEVRTRALFFDFLPHLTFYYQKLVLAR